MVDEKERTDVYEKIIEKPYEEQLLYRRNITEDTDIVNNTERNLLQENLNEKHLRSTDQVDYIRSDYLIDESVNMSQTDIMNSENINIRKRTDVRLFQIYYNN